MRRAAHYSSSPRAKPPVASAAAARAESAALPSWRVRLSAFLRRPDRRLTLGAMLLAVLTAVGMSLLVSPPAQTLTRQDVDAAVLQTLKQQRPGPSAASTAYDVIRPSVVLVRRLGEERKSAPSAGVPPGDKDAKQFALRGVGTGVVFSDDGLIFTNLHVVAGAEKIGVVFSDGTESDVDVVNVQPENDLAMLKARVLPDDLRPATLRTTRGLRSGDEVLAVGFPFGIGPTATFGVVSGLRREHYSAEGQRNLVDLIQFDAAANPGNSGGPLVTREGDVVGIVTSILNPTARSFFVGIAFAVPIENAAAAAGVSPF